MTQTEQNNQFRSRDAQEDSLAYHLGGLQAANNFRLLARAMIQEAEARGAAEQRRKDAEECCPVYQVWDDQGARWENCPEGNEDWRWTHAAQADKRVYYTHPANVAAMEARIAELEADKANAGWTFLTGNMSGDPRLPSCRLSRLFQEGDNFTRFKQAAEEFGIEVILKSDEREEEDWDEELSVEMLSRLDQHENLLTDGWSFVDVWDDEDGYIVRLFARPACAALTRGGGV